MCVLGFEGVGRGLYKQICPRVLYIVNILHDKLAVRSWQRHVISGPPRTLVAKSCAALASNALTCLCVFKYSTLHV